MEESHENREKGHQRLCELGSRCSRYGLWRGEYGHYLRYTGRHLESLRRVRNQSRGECRDRWDVEVRQEERRDHENRKEVLQQTPEAEACGESQDQCSNRLWSEDCHKQHFGFGQSRMGRGPKERS